MFNLLTHHATRYGIASVLALVILGLTYNKAYTRGYTDATHAQQDTTQRVSITRDETKYEINSLTDADLRDRADRWMRK